MDPSKSCETPLASSVPLFDPGQLPLKRWCAGSREDAVTGLVAFPDFHSQIPRALAAALLEGGLVGLAIGDVDGLKDHVEKANATEPGCYGHLAGNKVMARLGATTRSWFRQQSWESGCAATFGGDEVIIAAAIDDTAAFHHALAELRDQLTAALPVRVSFALTLTSHHHLPRERGGSGWKHAFTDRLLATVDRCLFTHKTARRMVGGEGGIIAVTEPPQKDVAGTVTDTRTLLPLPGNGQTLHVLARPASNGARSMLLLPCAGPPGLRGKRLRVTSPDGTTHIAVAVSLRGQAAIPHQGAEMTGSRIPLTLQPVRDRSTRGVPDDLSAALDRSGLDWSVLPAHEQAQVLHLITESASGDIRTARITAVIDAVATRTRS